MISTRSARPEQRYQVLRARCSAPGKLMLFGEYAVLEGQPALAMCLDRRIACQASLEPGSSTLRVEAPGVFAAPIELPAEALADEQPPRPELRLLWPLLQRHGVVGEGLSLCFEAGFPPTWGLGSSSASSLAAAAALRRLRGLTAEPAALFDEVRAAQRALQGAASGYDVATQILGGYVRFSDDGAPSMERVLPPLGSSFDWLVAWTGRKADTGDMIRKVSARHKRGAALYGEIGALTLAGLDALRAGDAAALGEALSEGQGLLERLGAAPPEIAELVHRLQGSPSVLGARLSGAGGGDCVLILAADRQAAIRSCDEQGLTVLPLAPEETGLMDEELQ